jgi:hypothetical protein
MRRIMGISPHFMVGVAMTSLAVGPIVSLELRFQEACMLNTILEAIVAVADEDAEYNTDNLQSAKGIER